MNILIVGARERDTEEDRQTVCTLMDRLDAEAPRSTFVSMLTHTGVGRFVKEKCLERDDQGSFRFSFIEFSTRVYSHSQSKSDLSKLYLARNASPFEYGDVLIYLASEDRRGTMEDMLDRFLDAHRPVIILRPGEQLPDTILKFEVQHAVSLT